MKNKIAIIGLGYVGLPLAVEFGKIYTTVGYDINESRINELLSGIDVTNEVTESQLNHPGKLSFSSDIKSIVDANIYIISVPTPIDRNNTPDLKILFKASSLVGKLLNKNDIVIFESTVYPGCTEDDCVPILEKESKMKYNEDFFCGYSPERINPGDKERTLTKIVKITSGSNPNVADIVDNLYKSIINVGTYKASSIRVAEAAKVIENCQRDINIAFINELSIIFDKMNLDTKEVLDAASTKWNFLSFTPGLVGGHCIGIDPYYLIHKAKEFGYHSNIMFAGRKLNDSFSSYISNNILDHYRSIKIEFSKVKVLILGITFKENCPDTRNSKVVNVYNDLDKNKINLDVYDPHASKKEVSEKYGINLIELNQIKNNNYDCILVAVAHKEFLELNLESLIKNRESLIYDLKGVFDNKNYRRL